MEEVDIIKAEKRKLLQAVTYKSLDYLITGFLTVNAPFLVTGIVGKIFSIILDKAVLGPLSEWAAKAGYYFAVDLATAAKVSSIKGALEDLRVFERKYDPSRPMTPEEKEANDKANKDIDDAIGFD